MKQVMFVGCHAGIRRLLIDSISRADLTCSAVAPVFSLGSRSNSREAVAILTPSVVVPHPMLDPMH